MYLLRSPSTDQEGRGQLLRRARKAVAEPATPVRRRRKKRPVTTEQPKAQRRREKLVIEYQWRGVKRGDKIRVRGFGEVPFMYHTLNPNTGAEWVTIFQEFGGYRSVHVRDITWMPDAPTVKRRRRKA